MQIKNLKTKLDPKRLDDFLNPLKQKIQVHSGVFTVKNKRQNSQKHRKSTIEFTSIDGSRRRRIPRGDESSPISWVAHSNYLGVLPFLHASIRSTYTYIYICIHNTISIYKLRVYIE